MKQVLTIAGSDSGGGAGIQADLKTMTRLKIYGASVITAVTAQNTVGVQDFVALDSDFIAAQLDSVLGDLEIKAAKTGMLATAEIVAEVAKKIKKYQVNNLVVDPVMVASSGDVLLTEDAVINLQEELIPQAAVITPNLQEAKLLAGKNLTTAVAQEKLAKELYQLGSDYVLVKGGHGNGKQALDVLYDGEKIRKYEAEKISTNNTHGTGCTLSAAIASNLALDLTVPQAIKQSKEFVTEAIKAGEEVGLGTNNPVNHLVELNSST